MLEHATQVRIKYSAGTCARTKRSDHSQNTYMCVRHEPGAIYLADWKRECNSAVLRFIEQKRRASWNEHGGAPRRNNRLAHTCGVSRRANCCFVRAALDVRAASRQIAFRNERRVNKAPILYMRRDTEDLKCQYFYLLRRVIVCNC